MTVILNIICLNKVLDSMKFNCFIPDSTKHILYDNLWFIYHPASHVVEHIMYIVCSVNYLGIADSISIYVSWMKTANW